MSVPQLDSYIAHPYPVRYRAGSNHHSLYRKSADASPLDSVRPATHPYVNRRRIRERSARDGRRCQASVSRGGGRETGRADEDLVLCVPHKRETLKSIRRKAYERVLKSADGKNMTVNLLSNVNTRVKIDK